ncbi:MAG: TolC family protein [Planctomycetota bacterium]|jgi:outer membrane protein TolC
MLFRFAPGRRWVLGLALATAGCRSYAPQPLEPEKILAHIAEERESAAATEVVSLREAADLMRRYNPRLQEVRAAYAVEQAVANVKQPLPNPTLDFAPIFTDLGSLGSDRWGGDLALGWTIVLGGKIRLMNELNAIRAEAAAVDVHAAERDEYLKLRSEMIALAMAGRIQAAGETLYKTAESSLAAVRNLVEAAQGTAIDVIQFEQQLYQAEADLAVASEEQAVAQAEVAARAGVGIAAFAAAEPPVLPTDVPTVRELGERTLRDHPELARLRALYAVAEKELQLELAYQYPDLNIAGLAERDEGTNKYGIGFGIELPVFDRNQPGIARADAYRNEIRARFEAEVRRALAEIDRAHGLLKARRRHLSVVENKLGPSTKRALDVARQSVNAGVVDGLRFLSVVQSNRQIQIRILKTQKQVFEAWTALETACGSPLLVFPEGPGQPNGPDAVTKEKE